MVVATKLRMRELTQREWFDALRVPQPHRNKKKYYRKSKHKNLQ
jgi:hypothetical protein